jgi:hypothetical protein
MDNNTKAIFREMIPDDLDMVLEVQHDAYEPQFYEQRRVLANKLELFSTGCWVCHIGRDMAGYLFSHPCLFNDPPLLDIKIEQLPSVPDCYFVHDLAIKRKFQSQGIGKLFARMVCELSTKFEFLRMSLMAVQGSHLFWAKMGFSIVPTSPAIADRLLTYGKDARFMAVSS